MNHSFFDTKYVLIEAFMHEASEGIVDVSFNIYGNYLQIQIVLLDNECLSGDIKNFIETNLNNFSISWKEIQISKNKFNETAGEWLPKYYNWLDYSLFSKAEIL